MINYYSIRYQSNQHTCDPSCELNPELIDILSMLWFDRPLLPCLDEILHEEPSFIVH